MENRWPIWLGYRDFRTLRLSVNQHVLIPRRETEHLVEWAIECIDAGAQRVLDLGTGSGAVALACKFERPTVELSAVDISVDALDCAKANARSLGLQVAWFHSDWFAQLPKARWDLVVSNPPYIAATDSHTSNRAIFPQSLTVPWSAGIPVWKRSSILLNAPHIISSPAVGYYLSMVLIRPMRLRSAF